MMNSKTFLGVAHVFRMGVIFLSAAMTIPVAEAAAAPRTFVIVHGMCGGGWDWRMVDRALRRDGHDVYRPTLTGLGERVHLASPSVSLTTHIDDIVNVILYEDLHDVVLVGHSYGGMVITGVMDRIPERIAHMVFLDATAPEDGESCDDILRETGEAPYPVVAGFLRPAWLSPAGAPRPRDEPQPALTFSEPVRFKNPLALKLPTTSVFFLKHGTQPDAAGEDSDSRFRRLMFSRAQSRGWQILTLESDHLAERTHVNELVALLEKIAQPSAAPARAK